MNIIICPKCREENPAEAVMCWACYTPLGTQSTLGVQSTLCAARRGEKIRKIARWIGVLGGVGLAIYGVRRRDNRGYTLAALSGAASLYGFIPKPLPFPQRSPKPRDAAEIFAAEVFDIDNMSAALADEAPIVRIANTILLYGAKDKASAISIEPQERGLQVNYQSNGEWYEQMKIPSYVSEPLAQRFKLMGGVDYWRKDAPDGQFEFRSDNRNYRVRVHSQPERWGEKIVLALEN